MRTLITMILTVAVILAGCVDTDTGEEDMSNERWERLSKGQGLGKRVVIAVPPTGFGEQRPGSVDILQIRGQDENACQLSITLLPPEFAPLSELNGGVFPRDLQALSTTRYNNSILSSPPPANFVAPPAIAVIKWGIGGVQAVAEVDFSNGAVVNVTASFLRVDVFVDLPSESLPEGTAVVLGAFVGPGWPKPNNAQRTYNVLPLLGGSFPEFSYGANGYFIPAPGEPGMYPTPFFGKTVWVIANDPNVAAPNTLNTLDANLIFYRDIAATILAGSYRVSNTNPGPIPVPNGAMYWSVQNNAPAISQTLEVVFDLAI